MGTEPFVACNESTRSTFNRLWAAIKQESLSILAEGVSSPIEIDTVFGELVRSSQGPCKLMDEVGLDTVALIQEHVNEHQGLEPDRILDFLRREYLDKGKFGIKSAKGGFYPRLPRILVLDLGIVETGRIGTSGRILELSAEGELTDVLVEQQLLPDGIDVDLPSARVFWTNMGMPGKLDGTVNSANLDGTEIQTLIVPGVINTPKQLVVNSESRKLYFSDREGMRILRCNFDGSGLETLVQAGTDPADPMSWCVGIQIARQTGKLYWVQKGPSKSRTGRIFCASTTIPGSQSAESRDDILCLLDNLPEPVDLELDSSGSTLFWTDRGEIPNGNSLNKVSLDPETGLLHTGELGMPQVLLRGLHDPIGLRLDEANGHIYTVDLGGGLYRSNLDGSDVQTMLSEIGRSFTGVTLL
ncbi:hypothetical protein F4677DRAFT_437269 [Hypoxylon crocopeplum]|nr:hypothetical protein F4677DRAFT_437269 [Hypoxylon crocopeplum]